MSTTQWSAARMMPVTEDRDHIQGPADVPPVTSLQVRRLRVSVLRCCLSDREGGSGPARRAASVRLSQLPDHDLAPARLNQLRRPREAAAAQGSFWQMHDVLYENQKRLRDEDLRTTPQQVGLDLDGVGPRTGVSTSTPPVSREDFMSGVRSGVNGTPTFYVNGARYDDSYDLDTLLGTLEEVLRSRRLDPRASTRAPRGPEARPENGYSRALADVAQLVEHFTRNEGVPGSNPGVGFSLLMRDRRPHR